MCAANLARAETEDKDERSQQIAGLFCPERAASDFHDIQGRIQSASATICYNGDDPDPNRSEGSFDEC